MDAAWKLHLDSNLNSYSGLVTSHKILLKLIKDYEMQNVN